MKATLALSLFIAGCAAGHPVVNAPVRLMDANPVLFINPGLPDTAKICVPRETFRYEGDVCISMGELRELLRSRRAISVEPR